MALMPEPSESLIRKTFLVLPSGGCHLSVCPCFWTGKTAAIIPPAGGVTGAHPITEPVPHKLHAARPTGQTEMRVGAPLPTQE